MPIFASLFVTMVVQVAMFLVRYLGVKLAMGVATVTVFSAMIVTLLALLKGTITALNPVISDTNFGVGLGLAFPPNASACLTAWFTVWTACTLYTWKSKALGLMKS